MHSQPERRRLPHRLVLIGLATLGLLLVAADQPQAARAAADVVLVTEDEVVDEDLYAGANVVTIDGTIQGDLIVWAFDRLTINGEVEGDVMGFATTAQINGKVGGSVRLIGSSITSAGEVGADVFAIGWSVRTAGSVGRDAGADWRDHGVGQRVLLHHLAELPVGMPGSTVHR